MARDIEIVELRRCRDVATWRFWKLPIVAIALRSIEIGLRWTLIFVR